MLRNTHANALKRGRIQYPVKSVYLYCDVNAVVSAVVIAHRRRCPRHLDDIFDNSDTAVDTGPVDTGPAVFGPRRIARSFLLFAYIGI